MITVAYCNKQRKVIWFGTWEKMPQNFCMMTVAYCYIQRKFIWFGKWEKCRKVIDDDSCLLVHMFVLCIRDKNLQGYCLARWIRPKLGSFERSSLQRRARKVFRKIRPPHHSLKAPSRYCPPRWIRPKLGSFDRTLLKETSRRVFRKIRLSPIE